MTLGIVSDCIHVQMPDGAVGTENHILLYQFEALANYFDKVIICCPFVEWDNSKVVTLYQNKSIGFLQLPNVGGNNWRDKLQLLKIIPVWWKSFKNLDKLTDIVYQRFPNNLNIPGFFFFKLRNKKVFATYTGTWNKYPNEPATYKFQKWLLRNWFKGPVWVYIDKPVDNTQIRKGFSPSYSNKVWQEEIEQVNKRIDNLIRNQSNLILKLISVGALVTN